MEAATACLTFRIPSLRCSTPRFSECPITLSANANPSLRFHGPLRMSLSTVRSRSRSRSCLRSLADDTASISPVEAAACEPSLEFKKKAAELSPELKGTSIFLLGAKTSIKSDLGKFLADALRYYYFDSDRLVEEAAGGGVAAKLLVESDEKGYRESEMLTQLATSLEGNRDGYATADATVSLQKVAYQSGYDELGLVTAEDMAFEVLKEIEKLTRVKKMIEAAGRPF